MPSSWCSLSNQAAPRESSSRPWRGVVDGQRLRGEDRRMPVGHARDQQPEPDPRRQAGQRRERRHPLERLARPVAVHRLEMVESPGAVEAELLRQLNPADELVPRAGVAGRCRVRSAPLEPSSAAHCNGRSNTIAGVDFSLTELRTRPGRAVPRLRAEGDRRPRPARLGRGPLRYRPAARDGRAWVCSAC